MPDFANVMQQGSLAVWFYLPTAVLLGALHGLEPGHSKTMMAAFIIAVRGTVPQAILLGISAMISHTAVIWALGLAAITWGDELIGEHAEPVIMLVSGVIVMVLAVWMIWQTHRAQRTVSGPSDHGHDHAHGHMHGHDHSHEHGHSHGHGHGHGHGHDHRHAFAYSHGHTLDHVSPAMASPGHHAHHAHVYPHADDAARDSHPEALDAHARHHARQIETQFAGRRVTNWQVIMFGLSGGLLPCSAAVAVLLVCLQLREYMLGVAVVGAFSLGLGLTLVTVGVVAAWGARRIGRHSGRLGRIAAKLPYLSGALVFCIGLAMVLMGWLHGGHHHA